MPSASEKRDTFRALHIPGDPLVMPNPWDIGSAKVLAGLGAKALATTSAGHAFTIGKPDMGRVTLEEAFAHAEDIVAGAGDLGPIRISREFHEELSPMGRKKFSRAFTARAKNLGEIELFTE